MEIVEEWKTYFRDELYCVYDPTIRRKSMSKATPEKIRIFYKVRELKLFMLLLILACIFASSNALIT